MDANGAFWRVPAQDLIQRSRSTPDGLTEDEARRRREAYRLNLPRARKSAGTVSVLLAQFHSPMVLILLFAAALALAVGDRSNPLIIMIIVLVSGLLGFWQEKGANDAVRKLLAIVQVKAAVLRDGQAREDGYPGGGPSIGLGRAAEHGALLILDESLDHAPVGGSETWNLWAHPHLSLRWRAPMKSGVEGGTPYSWRCEHLRNNAFTNSSRISNTVRVRHRILRP